MTLEQMEDKIKSITSIEDVIKITKYIELMIENIKTNYNKNGIKKDR